MFKKILVANRGEIAVRIIRACREMEIATAAVYSEVDRTGLHVSMADEAFPLGGAAAAESYLNIEKLIAVAKRCAAEAIHPGYGFLSENPHFAQACADAHIKFIGPSAAPMEMMGSKTRARQQMEKAGIPIVPGTSRALASLAEATALAARVGYPVMLKAAAGGGGKGMRLVSAPGELEPALRSAQSEALRAFGDGDVYLEKAVLNPRHIEIQVLGDEHGNIVYLGERECSIQRRHQKVIEEAPSAGLSEELRRRMGGVAVQVARAAGYSNAGTVEFLVDGEQNFYFLEMNTRLQVEHPVTEFVTGLDLVHLQIRIAAGERLPFTQDGLSIRGHAIECRIYAEDPDNNFFPSPGKITRLLTPAGPGIRLDSGVYEGWNVPLEYDPLLTKLIAQGSDRGQAIARLGRALDEYFIGGIKTNLPLFRRIVADEDFRQGRFDTGYLDRLLAGRAPTPPAKNSDVAAVSAGIFALLDAESPGKSSAGNANGAASGEASSNWKRTAKREALH